MDVESDLCMVMLKAAFTNFAAHDGLISFDNNIKLVL